MNVSCKVYDPYIQSVNPDGYWYRLADSPWNNRCFAAANTFMNGDPSGRNGPPARDADFDVPDCGAPPPPTTTPPPPASVVSLQRRVRRLRLAIATQ